MRFVWLFHFAIISFFFLFFVLNLRKNTFLAIHIYASLKKKIRIPILLIKSLYVNNKAYTRIAWNIHTVGQYFSEFEKGIRQCVYLSLLFNIYVYEEWIMKRPTRRSELKLAEGGNFPTIIFITKYEVKMTERYKVGKLLLMLNESKYCDKKNLTPRPFRSVSHIEEEKRKKHYISG